MYVNGLLLFSFRKKLFVFILMFLIYNILFFKDIFLCIEGNLYNRCVYNIGI